MGTIDKTIAIIGIGNMGGAILNGLIKAEEVNNAQLRASRANAEKAAADSEKYGVPVSTDNIATAQNADVVILAVKPYLIQSVIDEIKPVLKADTIVISVATGYSLANAAEQLGAQAKFARVMPNIPAQVGEGISGVVFNDQLTDEDKALILQIFNTIGSAEPLSETQLDAFTGIAGSSPAIIFMIIEAMADAGVAKGLTRPQALAFAKQAVKGAAQLAIESDLHPGALKDAVSTPGGTTIEEVRTAEAMNLRSTIIETMIAGIDKSASL
ncbi:pyrroline-5-carboxylate reductase [Aerococcus agrisoli]|uniref:Pyrroline-5-carboxylate reductase n=1 Tax=Aerococcus agrisoli TaxID=2487350 RepID=A0A3N4GR53_9LACT|nr:pyrroline-5-carboxylate reductase [Aerococcus agrisoli]RPA55544.1 pyrroline-5-carboxylate reductase [Aerococcus agrisoli]